MFENFPISKQQLKIFFGTFLSMFVMVSLQYLGVHFSLFKLLPKNNIVSPVAKQPDIFDTVKQKLEKTPSLFKLKTEPRFVSTAYAAPDAENANSYAVVDLDTGTVLAEKNGDSRVPIASLTKIMTAVVALDLAQPSELFTITPQAAAMPATNLGVPAGEKMTLEELLHAALMTSANDAAEAIRDTIDATYAPGIFIKAMNDKAAFLGLTNTHFTTPQGLDVGDNFSSALDLARLTQYAVTTYPLIATIVRKDYQFYPADQNHQQMDLYNWNGLLDVYPGAEGMKIGNTDAAGYTTVVVANRNGKRILADVLGAPGVVERDIWAAGLLDLGFQKTLGLDPVNVTVEQLKAKYATWKYWE